MKKTSKRKDDLFGALLGILILLGCMLTLPEMIKVINGDCLSGIELWSYRIGLASWIGLGIYLFKNKSDSQKRQ